MTNDASSSSARLGTVTHSDKERFSSWKRRQSVVRYAISRTFTRCCTGHNITRENREKMLPRRTAVSLKVKAVPEIYFRGDVSSSPFPSSPSPFLPFLLFSPCRIQLRNLGSAVSFPSGGERHLQPPDTFPGLRIHKACVYGRALATNAFLVYLEPRERVWWLQISSYFC